MDATSDIRGPVIGRLVVFGVGLIGGSFALALRKAGAVRHVVGVGRGVENMRKALELNVIDEASSNVAQAVAGADLVLLAVPVGQTETVMRSLAPHLEPQTIVTDAGSTKRDVADLAGRCLQQHVSRFVPAHPIAGAEHSGVTAASAELFCGKNVIITPLKQNAPGQVERVRAAWVAAGARVSEMAPETHDAVFAAVSHLPHLLAYALVDDIAGKPHAEQLFRFAASGFRDFTRIASSSPEMWRDICLANRQALLTELGAYQAQLVRLRGLLERADGAALEEVFAGARDARNRWLEEQERAQRFGNQD